ncbi:MAG: MFS transporter [Acetobacteraceae bacterium]|nr:MFS transporter [Acetobacteraceae bacterium]
MSSTIDAVPARLSRRRAWVLLVASFATFAIGAGAMHAYTVFLIAFIEAFGWTRAESSIAYAVSQLFSGASSPLVGFMVDRLGPRRMVLIGGVLLTAGLLASAYATALWQTVVLYGVIMTIGANCLGLVVFVPLLSRRFVRNRGMAVSVVQSANGFARAYSAPVSQLLIDTFGWRGAYVVQGAFMATAVLPLAALFRQAEPDRQAASGRGAIVHRGWTVRQAMRTVHFWLLFLVYVFTGLGSFLVALHQLAFAVTVGFDKLYAAWVLGFGAFLSLPGVIITGTISDYIGRELSAVVTYGTSIFGVACALLITGPDQHLLLWLHACFFGLTWGARGPAITAKTADLFPGPNLGAILGVITIGTGIGAAGGSWMAGWIFDLTGSYRFAFMLSILFYLCGSIAFWALRRPPAAIEEGV